MSEIPKVSVVIATYNRASFLAETIDSVLQQRFQDYELIVVDDGSTDQTRTLVESYGSRIRYLYHENRGPSAARNLAVRHARAPWIAFQDSDDLTEPNHLETLYAYANEHPRCGMVFANGAYLSGAQSKRGTIIPMAKSHRLATNGVRLVDLFEKSIVRLQASLISREAYDLVGGHDESLRICMDLDLSFRLLMNYPVAYVDRVVFWYRFHEGNIGKNEELRLTENIRVIKKLLEQFPESKRIFLNDGKFVEWGDTFKQPDLAATFARLQEKGPREFYTGKTAELIAADMKANGGLITLEDLKNYKAIERKPLVGTYRGYEVITMPPPSSGGPALLEMLNILENYDVAKLEANSADKYHLMIEAMRRSFADRAEFLGDPAFVDVPTKGLISKAYAKEIMGSIKMDAATPSTVIGHGKPAVHESDQTTHFTVVDAEGNVVTQTYTLNFGYGCGATVKGAGFLLNDEMDDLAAKPGSPNGFGLVQGEANSVQPGKRPLSSMTPTIVLDKDHKLWFAIGSPGGPTIINTVLQVIVNIIDHKMNLQQAIDAPRVHHQWLPDLVQWEPYGLSPDVLKILKERGHQFQAKPGNMGDAEGIMIDSATGIRLGAADPRADGKAIGY